MEARCKVKEHLTIVEAAVSEYDEVNEVKNLYESLRIKKFG